MPLGLGLCQATVARFEMTEKEGLLEVRVCDLQLLVHFKGCVYTVRELDGHPKFIRS